MFKKVFRSKSMVIMMFQFTAILIFWLSFNAITSNKVEPVVVVEFAKSIDEINTEIMPEHLKEVTIPASAISEGMATSKEALVGKYIVTKVSAGQYAYDSQFVEMDKVDVFESMDLSQYRKISLPTSYVDCFAGNVKKGDRVDLVFTGEGSKASETGRDEPFDYAVVFQQNVLVYNVSTGDGFKFLDHSQQIYGEVLEGQNIDVEDSSEELEIITLAVPMNDAEEIMARLEAGEVRILGRFEDSQDQAPLGYVVGDYDKVFTGYANAETGRTMVEEPEASK